MSARAQERMALIAAEEARIAEENDPHRGHHGHLRGTAVECSCGEFQGLACVAFPRLDTEEERAAYRASLVCRICGERDVVALSPE